MTERKIRKASGVSLIAVERQRQQRTEGFTRLSDLRRPANELARAAAVYALPPGRARDHATIQAWPSGWEFKPKDRKSDLIRAGALVAAELDRLIALEPTETNGDDF